MIYLIDVIVIYIQSDKARSMKQIEDQCSLHIRVEMERLEGGVKDNMFDPSLADKVDVGDQRMKYLSELKIFYRSSPRHTTATDPWPWRGERR